MNGLILYKLYREELLAELDGTLVKEWAELDPLIQIAWGRLTRRLQAEFGLDEETWAPSEAWELQKEERLS